jgi:hypothetical protein
MDRNSKAFTLHLERQLICKSDQVKKLGKSIEKEDMGNPFTNNLLKKNKKSGKKTKLQKLANTIAEDENLSIFGFVQKEVAFLKESKNVLNYMKAVQKNSDYCQKLKINQNTKENEPIPSIIRQSFNNFPVQRSEKIMGSPVQNKFHSKTGSVYLNKTPKREIFTKAISEQHYSDSKLKKEIPKSLRQNSYIKEKIGENRYIYRLSGRVGKQSTLESMYEKPKEHSIEHLQKVEEEKTVNLSKELVLKSISQITGTVENHKTIETEKGHNEPMIVKKQSQRDLSLKRQIEDNQININIKEEEILRLKQENNRLNLKNKELTSMNEVRVINQQLLKNELDQTLQQIEDFSEIKGRKMNNFEKINMEKFEESLKVYFEKIFLTEDGSRKKKVKDFSEKFRN